MTVGTVAEEAARLIEMLAGSSGPWATTGDAPGGPANGSGANGSEGRRGAGSSSTGQGAASHTCTCGGTAPQACRLCPICQLISFVSSISPETIERAADLVDFAATALRDLATAQRGRQESGADPAPPGDEP